MSTAEKEALRAQTSAFIAADPTAIILSRAEMVPNGAGGTRLDTPSPLPAQVFKMQIPSAGGQQGERNLLDGQVVQVDYVLVCEWNADIKRGDWFYKDGIKYEVVTVRSTADYEIKAEVTNRG